MKARVKVAIGGIVVVFVLAILIASCYVLVSSNASDRIFDDVKYIPHNKVGLLLATSPITPGGAHNFYFENRIKAADEL